MDIIDYIAPLALIISLLSLWLSYNNSRLNRKVLLIEKRLDILSLYSDIKALTSESLSKLIMEIEKSTTKKEKELNQKRYNSYARHR